MYQTTQLTLLARLKENHPRAWQEFSVIYKSLIFNWLKKYALQAADAEDVAQEVMLFVSQNIHTFEHNGRLGAFRNWLRSIAVNITRNYLRKKGQGRDAQSDSLNLMLEQLEDPDSPLTRLFNLAHDHAVVAALVENLAEHFEAKTIDIFKLNVIDELSAAEIAEKMNVTTASVHVAKSRVLRRLRQDAKNWLDDLQLD